MNVLIQDHRRGLLALGALALLCVAGGLSVVLRPPPADEKPAGIPDGMFVPPPPPPVKAPAAVPAPDGSPELSFGKFMDLLAVTATKPEVAAAAREVEDKFKADPQLKALYKDFNEKHRDEKGSASQFVAQAREIPAFQRIVNQFGGQAGASGAVMALQATPGLRNFVTEQYRALAGGAKGVKPFGPLKRFQGAKGMDADALTREWAKKGISGVNVGVPGGGGGATGGGDIAGVGTERYPGAGMTVGSEVKSAPINSGGGDPSLSKIPGAALKASDLRMLKLIEKFPWIAGLSDGERQALLDGAERGIGVWGACFSGKFYDRCEAVCKDAMTNNRRASCTLMEPWYGCMEAYNNDIGRCLQECTIPGCRVPDALAAQCTVAVPPPACGAKPGKCRLVDTTTGRPAWTIDGWGGASPESNGECKPSDLGPVVGPVSMIDGRMTCYVPNVCPAWGCGGNLEGIRNYRKCIEDGGEP